MIGKQANLSVALLSIRQPGNVSCLHIYFSISSMISESVFSMLIQSVLFINYQFLNNYLFSTMTNLNFQFFLVFQYIWCFSRVSDCQFGQCSFCLSMSSLCTYLVGYGCFYTEDVISSKKLNCPPYYTF